MAEKRLGSLEELFEALAKLELDEGVRVKGRIRGRECYIFVTKSTTGYTLAVFEAKRDSIGRQLFIRDSLELERVKRFIEENCEVPLKAYRY